MRIRKFLPRTLALFLSLSVGLPAFALHQLEPSENSGLEEKIKQAFGSSTSPSLVEVGRGATAGLEERGNYADAVNHWIDRLESSLRSLRRKAGKSEAQKSQILVLDKRFKAEIAPLRGDPDALFAYLEKQDRPPSSFQDKVRDELASLSNLPKSQIIFVPPGDLLIWGLMGKIDEEKFKANVAGVAVHLKDQSGGRLKHFILVRNDSKDFNGLVTLAHEIAHTQQSDRARGLMYNDPLAKVIAEGFQGYREYEILLLLASRNTSVGRQVKKVIADTLRGMHQGLPLLARLHGFHSPRKRSDSLGYSLSGRLWVYLGSSFGTNPAYEEEREFVRRLIARVGIGPVRALYQQGNLKKLRYAPGLGPVRFDALRLAFLKFDIIGRDFGYRRETTIRFAAETILNSKVWRAEDTRLFLKPFLDGLEGLSFNYGGDLRILLKIFSISLAR
ncbi:MAG: hypothetical protein HY211_01050 [Candidatus Omnitrophica bacterium]|nr:hypothetical protein [Candidatus Omnitrophota bacterium]